MGIVSNRVQVGHSKDLEHYMEQIRRELGSLIRENGPWDSSRGDKILRKGHRNKNQIDT